MPELRRALANEGGQQTRRHERADVAHEVDHEWPSTEAAASEHRAERDIVWCRVGCRKSKQGDVEQEDDVGDQEDGEESPARHCWTLLCFSTSPRLEDQLLLLRPDDIKDGADVDVIPLAGLAGERIDVAVALDRDGSRSDGGHGSDAFGQFDDVPTLRLGTVGVDVSAKVVNDDSGRD